MSIKVPYGKSRDAIAAAARELFLELGYAAISMDALATRASVSRRTIYNQYESKEAIFRDVVTREWRAFELLMPALDPEGDPSSVMHAGAMGLIQFLCRDDFVALTRMMIAESRHFPWLNGSLARASFQPLLDRFVDYLRALEARGVLCCRRPEIVANQLIGGLTNTYFWPLVQGDTTSDLPDLSEAVDEAIYMVLTAYAAPLDEH
ncbi:MAG: TetR/AcrR family transcriptional regulator [Myxococcota bacterium]|nr:TetR/AcrR family transcriptional regulator [Myxococcota bacterium]